MAAKELAVKKYVVKLSVEARDPLETLIRGGQHPARKSTRARILLKADAGEAGEGWSDRRIAAALDTGLATNRNKHHAKADWQFTTADARIKWKQLYPAL